MSLGFTRHPKLASLENNPLRQIEALGIVFSVDADMAQLVEHHLAKVRVAGSNLVFRSKKTHAIGAGKTPSRVFFYAKVFSKRFRSFTVFMEYTLDTPRVKFSLLSFPDF